jgi:hypothetical protein
MATLINQGAESANNAPAQNADPAASTQTENPAQSASAPSFIPEAFRSEKVFEGVKSVDDVFKMAVEGQKMIGRGIFLPDDKDPDDVKADKWNKVYSKLGRPDSPDKYDFKTKATLPEGYEWNKDAMAGFSQLAHKVGLSQNQLSAVLDFYAETMGKSAADPAVFAKQTKEALVKEWGENGYELHLNEAYAASHMIGGKEFLSFLDETGMGNHPVMIKFLAKIGRELREDGVIDDSIVNGFKSSHDYEAEAMKIIADPQDPYNQPKHAEHKARVAHVNKLWEMSTK